MSLFWNLRPSETGRQIVMFPFLGGFGASFNGLVKNLSGDWDIWTVNPPGHGPSKQPLCYRMDSLVDCYLESLESVLKPGALFFGHSMGGVVAYHVLLAMTRQHRFEAMPTDLVISAANAPRNLPVTACATKPDSDLIEHLKGFNGISDEVAMNRQILDLFLPSIRADYHVLENAKGLPAVKLDISTHLILGERDPQTSPTTPMAWQEYIESPIRTHVLDGEGHMFVQHAFDPLDRILNDVNLVPAGQV